MISAIIIVGILLVGFAVTLSVEKSPHIDRIPEYFAIALITSMVMAISILAENDITGKTYKDGFIDAKIGKQTYVLEVQLDSTRIWVKND
jgi:hypothetical protein